jgi:DDB1- and CUL4-associated factor 13
VKTITRSSDTYLARKGDQPRLPRNLDPALHPLAKAREYTRALNATKLERLFAKPFVAQLGNGHIDGVYCIAKDWRKLPNIASGSGDGVVKAWDLVSREEKISVRAHEGIVKGLCYTVDGRLLSCSTDKMIKLWEPGTKEVRPHVLLALTIARSNIYWSSGI